MSITGNDYVIEKVRWFNNLAFTDDYMNQQCRFFENYVRFLQQHGFTTRTILGPNNKANNESEIRVSDLTCEGFEFFKYGIVRWRKKLDRAKDREKAISDINFINKKLEEFKIQQQDTHEAKTLLSRDKFDEAKTIVVSVLKRNPLYGPAKELLSNIQASIADK
ncbi:hypothetical protein [uncultured Bacteroides sp.]|uniref:hypothetical protein n=1 Tax=uncultured Bacteroides sp. TaxID=162156 RepID=UPI002624D6AD|nr:hypothetical protein [uncultured Bacteroides sp.]